MLGRLERAIRHASRSDRLPAALLLALGMYGLYRSIDGPALTAWAHSFWESGKALFRGPGAFAGLGAISWPALAFVAGGLAICTLCPSRPVWARGAAVALLVWIDVRYLLWRLFDTLNLDDGASGAVSLLFYAVEVGGFTYGLLCLLMGVATVDRSPEADRASRDGVEGRYRPSVDIFIMTYSEPAAVLRRTIIGCQALDYDKKRIFVLDDGHRPQIRALAGYMGCVYIDRPRNVHYKAGNYNNALPRAGGELIASFDADFVPARNFLVRTVGFLQDPRVGLVETPQVFMNPDPVQRNLGVEDTLTEDQASLFLDAETSRDAWGVTLCHGTSFVVRRSALDRIGGVPTESLTEDLALSLKMSAAGYRVIYLNEVLSVGMAAEDMTGYLNQRLRWTQGTLQLLFTPLNPLTIPGLGLAQRVLWFGTTFMNYLMCIPRIVFLLLPLTYLLGGLLPMRTSFEALLFYAVPCYGLNIAMAAWLNGRLRAALWSDVYLTLLCFPQAWAVATTLVRPFGKGFVVTAKNIRIRGISWNWRLAWPLCAVAALLVAGWTYRWLVHRWDPYDPDHVTVIFFWTAVNLAYVSVALQATIDCPQERTYVRCPHALRCTLEAAGRTLAGTTVDLSEGGAQVRLAEPLPAASGADAKLSIPEIGLRDVRGRVRRRLPEGRLGIEFIELGLDARRRLVELLFCRPYVWGRQRIREPRSTWELLRSVFRLHALANTR